MILNNLIARIKLGMLIRNHSGDCKLDEIFTDVMKYDVNSVKVTQLRHDLILEWEGGNFSHNSYLLYAWNANKPYAWLQRGHVKRNGEVTYAWDDQMPSSHVMLKFKQWLDRKDVF